MAVEVRFRPGSPFSNKSAPGVEQALETVAREDGTFNPPEVVEVASEPANALHPHIFYCDDARAAYEHRLDRARMIVRAVQVRVLRTDNQEAWVPKYNRVQIQTTPGQTEGRYAPLAVVQRSPDLVAQVQERLLAALLACRREYETHQHLPEFHQRFAAVFEEVDRLAMAAD